MVQEAQQPPESTVVSDRFGMLVERPDDADFPFYNGNPVALSAGRWLLVMAAVVVGFGCLFLEVVLDGPVTGFVPALLFSALPLAALRFAAGRHWTALFRRVRLADLGAVVSFAALTIVLTMVLGFVVAVTVGADKNPVGNELDHASGWELVAFFPHTLIQLLGEELLTILPFLALLTWFSRRGVARRNAVVWAWSITALVFGLMHLPTYDWNVVQCVVVIGSARLVLTLAYIRTKSLWVCTGTHVLYDWALFALALAAPGLL